MCGRARTGTNLGSVKKTMNLLLATAPWPVLVRIVTTRPGPWTVWGEVPAAVTDFLDSAGHTVLPVAMPSPLHHHELPGEIASTPWRSIVVPSLGHPLPTRWPIVRHLSALERTVIVSDGSSWQWIHHEDIPSTDAFTWAIDRLAGPPADPPASVETDLLCVRADLLGDVLLAWPAVEAAARERRVTLLTRDYVAPWMAALAGHGIEVRGMSADEWTGEPRLPAADEAADLSAPDSTWPLTPALVHAAAVRRRHRLDARRASLTLGEMLAGMLGVDLPPAGEPRATGDRRMGILCPSGSTPERDLDASTWGRLARLAGDALGIDRWTVVGTPRDRAAAIAAAVPNASYAGLTLAPAGMLALIDAAAVALGVSTALSHLAALRRVPTIVIEHPTRVPFVSQVPGSTACYLRPSSPWWRPHPDATDIARATAAPGDSYGFVDDELTQAVEEALTRFEGSKVRRFGGSGFQASKVP